MIARGNGSKLKMLAVNYEKAPYAVFSLANGANVTEPKQLEGLNLGSGAGSFTPKIIQGFMSQKGLDPAKLTISNVAPPARASTLLSGQIPAIEFFVMSKPGLEAGAKTSNTELRTLLLADHGLELYGNGIAATENTIAKVPDMLKRFVRASLKGWKFALANPQKAAADEIQSVPTLKPEGIVAEIGVVGDLAVTRTPRKRTGLVRPGKDESQCRLRHQIFGVNGTPPAPTDIYATGFLPASPVTP